MINLMWTLLKKPRLLFSLLRPLHIKNFFIVIFFSDKKERQRVLNYYSNNSESDSESGALTEEIIIEQPLRQRVENTPESKTYQIPVFDIIDVSIIVPVYNQWKLTKDCLISIISSVTAVRYEIILADDCSTDDTVEAKRIFKNLVVSQPKQNQGFLLNCNMASKIAKGRYLMIVNNDTIVHQDWLRELFSYMEDYPDVAIAGSKLVYLDESLQEAGGVIWNSADGWNYGRNDDPGKPEYNYVKDVDYVSGASLMVRGDFWDEVGGFDERFAPAYYEDTDLAFQARKLGYRVIYHPHSVITHLEGKSHGTDERSGIKSYQMRNKKLFLEKWKSDLVEQQFPPTASRMFHARDRSLGKRTILFIDHYVPWFDQDAGSRSTFMYVNFLVELGYNVKFIGDNFFPHQPYTKVLQRLGVEVFYGNYYANNWRDWILDNAMHIDVAYLHRPHIASKYIDLIKKHTKAKVVYQCHDLHHLRVGREAEVKDSQQLRDEAENLRKTEIELFKKADVGVTFSRDEREIIQQWSIDSKILQIPLYLYDSAVSAFPEFNKRSDILFVGGFNHTPNKEGLEWFIEFVLPLISIEIPSIVLHIVGGHSESLAIDCENKNVKIHGRLSDQELDNLYKHVKLSVLPLRYGAGVKGKLVESMYYQIPVVSTSIGLEGIKSDKYGLAAHDTAESFAKSIIKLVSDEQSWLQSAECSKFLFQDNFVKENLSHLIKEVF